MDAYEFRKFLDLLMCCDPWPVAGDDHGEDAMKSFANRQSQEWGFTDWIDAYHNHSA